MINLRLATTEDAEFISKLHYQYIPSGFLSSLGISFLELLYESIINSKYSFCIVAEEDERTWYRFSCLIKWLFLCYNINIKNYQGG